ncbi:hypothetical protein [Burkholderia ubonensis]|uniref:hypothetical protein n=1 Tax=Burkholderia ubonensis TaxID=101571 RepID=UPI0012F8FF3E|nr:hypothetical protein [Burkholderia ubonensis]
MQAPTLLGVVLTSTVIASVLSVFSTMHVTGRNALTDNVIKHRANWRDMLRTIARELTEAVGTGNVRAIRVLRNQLALNLNPVDQEDQALVDVVRALERCSSTERYRMMEEVEQRIALLLKHDWERAKWEAKLFHFARRMPKRMRYSIEVTQASEAKSVHLVSTFATIGAWCKMVGAAAVLFFLAAGLLKPFTDLVIAFNDVNQSHDRMAWIGFALASTAAGFIWSIFHLIFKVSEKRLVDNMTRSAS